MVSKITAKATSNSKKDKKLPGKPMVGTGFSGN
jgi:hypothetical protein